MSVNFERKFNHIKKILSNGGINDFSGFDVTFVEFFISSILDESLSRPELFDMLQALCPETEEFAEEKKQHVLDSILQSIKNTEVVDTIENELPTKVSSNIPEIKTSATNVIKPSEVKESSSDVVNQLAAYEVSILTTQLKAIFNDSNTRITSSFDTDSIMTLVGLVKETNNQEIIVDIICQFFPSTIGNTYVQGQIIKTLKSSKAITTSSGSVNSSKASASKGATDEIDEFEIDTTEEKVDMESLKNQFPHIDDDVIRYVFKILCAFNPKQALKVLSTNDLDELESLTNEHKLKRLEQKKEQSRETSRIKALVTKNFSETQDLPTVDENGKLIKRPAIVFMSTVGGGNQKTRYRDGVVVTHRGEKVIVEKNPFDDYDGGSRGKVKTKRKGGPGWV